MAKRATWAADECSIILWDGSTITEWWEEHSWCTDIYQDRQSFRYLGPRWYSALKVQNSTLDLTYREPEELIKQYFALSEVSKLFWRVALWKQTSLTLTFSLDFWGSLMGVQSVPAPNPCRKSSETWCHTHAWVSTLASFLLGIFLLRIFTEFSRKMSATIASDFPWFDWNVWKRTAFPCSELLVLLWIWWLPGFSTIEGLLFTFGFWIFSFNVC